MAKWYDKIGYAEMKEVRPGIWEEEITERFHSGDVMSQYRRLQVAGKVNDDVNISNKISIVADPFARDHFVDMRYAVYYGVKWKITDVEVQYPRLILTLGGKWNENTN